jgi:hypothetical protein
MKRIMIAMLLLACIFLVQGRLLAQVAVATDSQSSWMTDGDDGQPAPDDGGGGAAE